MVFPKFSEWVSLREDVSGAMANKGATLPKPGSVGIKKPDNPKIKMALTASLKKNKGKVKPDEIIDAVSKSGASTQELIQVAKEVGEGS